MNKKRYLWKRIFYQYTVLIVIAFSFVFVTLLFSMSKNVIEEKNDIMVQHLKICSSKLDSQIEEIIRFHWQLLNSCQFRDFLSKYFYNSGLNGLQKESLYEYLCSLKNSFWLVNSIHLFDLNYELIGSSNRYTTQGDVYPELKTAMQAFSRSQAFRAFFETDDTLYFIGSVYLDKSYQYKAIVLLTINWNRMFYNFLKLAQENFHQIYLVSDGKIICSSDPESSVTAAQLINNRIAKIRGISFSVFHNVNVSYTGWHIYALMDQQQLRIILMQQANAVAVILCISIIVTMILSRFIAKGITYPLKQLSQSFQRLEQGEYPPSMAVPSNDEIGELIHSYNHVVSSLKELNENIMSEQEEKRKVQIAAIKTRLDLLQSQIQPHFIHNTLHAINCMAIEAGNTEVSETIASFNALLRMSISTGSDFFTVDSELTCIRHYMHIQKIRYGDRDFDCIYSVDEEARSALLPRLILQPLVENALYHGILPCEDRAGIIQVKVTTDGTSLFVSVTDDGTGITEEKLDIINRGEAVFYGGYSHIGIKNVKERLQLLYHQECEFKISSAEGHGTTISFRVPCEEVI